MICVAQYEEATLYQWGYKSLQVCGSSQKRLNSSIYILPRLQYELHNKPINCRSSFHPYFVFALVGDFVVKRRPQIVNRLSEQPDLIHGLTNSILSRAQLKSVLKLRFFEQPGPGG